MGCGGIHDQGIEELAKGLKHEGGKGVATLERLDLSWNCIDDMGAAALGDALKDNKVALPGCLPTWLSVYLPA